MKREDEEEVAPERPLAVEVPPDLVEASRRVRRQPREGERKRFSSQMKVFFFT